MADFVLFVWYAGGKLRTWHAPTLQGAIVMAELRKLESNAERVAIFRPEGQPGLPPYWEWTKPAE